MQDIHFDLDDTRPGLVQRLCSVGVQGREDVDEPTHLPQRWHHPAPGGNIVGALTDKPLRVVRRLIQGPYEREKRSGGVGGFRQRECQKDREVRIHNIKGRTSDSSSRFCA